MSARALGVLALITVLAVGALWYVQRPQPSPASSEEQGLFLPGLADRLEAITAIRARTGGGRELAHAVRTDQGWRVRNRADYPADRESLRGLLIKLSRAERVAAKTDRPEAWPRLGLAPVEQPGAAGVELTLEGLDPPVGVIIGKPAAGEDASGTYARRSDASGGRAWLISASIERPDAIAYWLDDRLLQIPARRVRAVTIDPREGETVEVRRADDDFTIANRPADRRPLSNTVARSLARVIADLRLTDVRPVNAGSLPPQVATARYETFDGLVVTARGFAAAQTAGRRYIRLEAKASADAPAAVREEARQLNARFDGWAYEIREYKFVNLTHNLEGVLAEPRQ